jgi:hypothetical protein
VETILAPVAVEETPVIAEEDVSEEEAEEDGEVMEIEEPVDRIRVYENVVSDVKETEDGFLSAQEIQDLYESLGTWSAVAKHLSITTTTLRKYREELGLL